MNKRFLEELEKEEHQEKITIKDLHQVCKELILQTEEVKTSLNRFQSFTVRLDESGTNLMKSVSKDLKAVQIPSKIKLICKQEIDIKNSTRKFLIWFFCCSLFIVVSSLGFAWYAYQYQYVPKKELEVTDLQHQWLINYVQDMADKNPKTHSKYLQENPIPE